MYIDVNNTRLYYEIIGKGDPLILLHGNGEDHHIFDSAVTILKDYFTCYCIDSRGHGQSMPIEKYDYQEKIEGYSKGEWIVFDFNTIMLHIFLPKVREKYNLDKLYKPMKIYFK